MIPYSWLLEAAQRIEPYILETPLIYDPEHDLYLKWENRQITGSFKARGAFNKILTLKKWEQEKGVTTASSGNHGLAVALAGQQVGSPVTIYIPENAVQVKIDEMVTRGAKIQRVPGGFSEAVQAGIRAADSSEKTWISPYDDGQVIAGQGTVALDILRQLEAFPDLNLAESCWVVPTMGGGLTAGIGAALAELFQPPRLVAVQAEASPYMYTFFKTGTQEGVEELPTIADGLAGPVETGSVTIPMIRQYVDDFVLVSEEEIIKAIAAAWHRYGEKIEGSSAVALDAVLSRKIPNRPAVVILTGDNIPAHKHDEIVSLQGSL